MTVRQVHRPARAMMPPAPEQPQLIEAPPTMPEGKAGGAIQALFPIVGVTGSVIMMTLLRSGSFIAIGAILLVVVIAGSAALLLSQRGQAGRRRRQNRERYLDYLEDLRAELAASERRVRAAALPCSPAPAALYDIVRNPERRWERRRPDSDFLRVRAGTGEVPRPAVAIKDQGSVLAPTDPFMLNEARGIADRFATIPQMPLTVPLDRAGNVSVVGGRQDVLTVVRVLLTQAAVFHAPEDISIAVACGGQEAGDWDWVKWLPHVLDPGHRDGPVSARRMAASPAGLAIILADDLAERAALAAESRRGLVPGEQPLSRIRRLLVVHDTHGAVAAELPRPDDAIPLADMGITVVHLVADRAQEPGDVTVRLTMDGEQIVAEDLREPPWQARGTVDDLTPATAEGIARMLAPLRLSADEAAETGLVAGPDFAGLMNITDMAGLDFGKLWSPRSDRAFLRVPIGADDAGRPVLLDLKEAAQYGMGPHGLCVGATGTGKSELLRTLVLALLLTHSPDQLSMILVDYKGGAAFAPFGTVPHVAGVITNLENNMGLIERAYASLAGEVQRRQQVLRDAGNVTSIGGYWALRAERPGLEPLPYLLVIIDEFGELLAARPDFIDLFLSIGRIGRAIGVHLLLSSQRIEGGKLKGLETYLSYRLGLRTFSGEESRTVLDTPDAFNLPALPGYGYLKVDTSTYTRFKGAHVSAAFREAAEEAGEGDRVDGPLPYPAFNVLSTPAPADGEPVMPERTTAPTLLDVAVRQLAKAGDRVPKIWLPPLPAALPLDLVGGTVQATADGLRLERGRQRFLAVPIGLLDDPARQWSGVWDLDLTVAGGHAAIIGGPASGKTTLLRTFVTSLALTHTPREAIVYAIDLVGGGLPALAGFPHVGGVAGRFDRERIRRTAEEVHGMLEHREAVFRARGIDSVERLRDAHAAGEVPELPSADVILLIDGFGGLREEFEEIGELVTDILQRGSGFGVHVVAATLRWNDVRLAVQATFGTKIELRLGDPVDSTVAPRLAETIHPGQAGRALTSSKLFGQVALPRIDGVTSVSGLGDVVARTALAVRAAWPHDPAPAVRVLPLQLPADAVPGAAAEPGRVPIGIDENALRPVLLDLFGNDQSLIVLGDSGCGKTNLVRVITDGLTERYSTAELVFAVMDPRRSLADAVPEQYVGGYAGNARVCAGLATGIAEELQGRLPDEKTDQRAQRPVTGPRIVVIADDYDVLAAGGSQPLTAFVPYTASGRDIGLHFVVTRRVAGGSRGLFEPLLTAIRESGCATLVMSGDRGEGPLLPGTYAAHQPPGRGLWVRRGEGKRLIQTVHRSGAA